MNAGDLVILNENITKKSVILTNVSSLSTEKKIEIGEFKLKQIGFVITTSGYDSLSSLVLVNSLFGWIDNFLIRKI